VPYVPTPSLSLLQRDTFAFESELSYDGGEDGMDVLRRVVADSPAFLRPGGTLLLELGGDQAELLGPELERVGFDEVQPLLDEEDDVRGIEATLTGPPSAC
jgi:release factor glutamine methyltransferase